ncbi:hypothetical protein K3495_g11825 [Podosphaera aphanis]|nr:hypothetical protein K3495_g11825 [Podosphaera aphanis]
MPIYDIKSISEFETIIVDSHKKVAVVISLNFGEAILHYFDVLSIRYTEILFTKVDAYIHQDIVEAVQAREFPYFIFYDDGKIHSQFVGDDLVQMCNAVALFNACESCE